MRRRPEPPIGTLSDLARHERETGELRPAEADLLDYQAMPTTCPLRWKTAVGAIVDLEVPRWRPFELIAKERRSAFHRSRTGHREVPGL